MHPRCSRIFALLLFPLAGVAALSAQPPSRLMPAPGDAPVVATAPVRRAGIAPALPTSSYGDASYGLVVQPAQREWSRIFYGTVYQASAGVPSGWTGNAAQGVAGTTSPAFRESIVLRINYYRAMAGVPAAIALSDDYNAKDQQAALMMSANNALSHQPPTTWIDYTADGATAAGHSNLTLIDGAEAIDSYIQDLGTNNSIEGHRRWVLYPPKTIMGSGDADGSDTTSAANALWVLPDGTDADPAPAARDGFVAWPPPGYVPYSLVFPRWSFSLPGANLHAATVTMTRGGQPVPVQQETVVDGYGDNTLGWVPDNRPTDGSTPLTPPPADVTDTVTIANVTLADGTTQAFTYQVTVFDPSRPGADQVLPALTGAAQLSVGQAGTYQFNAVPHATGYQWTAYQLSALTLLDDAESGAGDVTITPAGTNVVASQTGETGNACYQFFSYPTETMTLNPVIVPAVGSMLRFDSMLAYAEPGETAEAQISSDGGATWSTLYALSGAGGLTETAFATHASDLSAYAGLTCRVRFVYTLTGGSYYVTSTDVGWFVDNVAVTGAQTTATTVSQTVAAGQTAFSFAPPGAGTYALQVTPLFFGTYPADAGPLSVVTAGTGDAGAAPVVTGSGSAGGQVGAAFSYQITAANFPTAFAASGLPDGLAVNASTGLISGTPAASGTFSVTLSASNPQGTGTAALVLTVASAPGHPGFFTGEVGLGSGVYYLALANGNPFGYYAYLADPAYIYHFDLGYEYVFDAGDGASGVFLYDFASGTFFYTSPVFAFPYLYDFTLSSVLYYFPNPGQPGHYNTDGTRYFYEFATGKVISK